MNSYQPNHARVCLFVTILEFHSTCLAFNGSFEVLQALDGYSVMNYTAPERYCSSPPTVNRLLR